MTLDQTIALALFLMAATITPGPNNAMLAASGARFGYMRTLPHALGIILGFPAMLFAIALGLGEVFQQSVFLREGLRVFGAAVMLWIAWKIATAPAASSQNVGARPMRFIEAAGFQWINPKAWVMCIAVVSQYLSGSAVLHEALACTAVAIAVSVVSANSWAGFGAMLQRVLAPPRRWRIFSVGMAAIIVLGVFYTVTGNLTV